MPRLVRLFVAPAVITAIASCAPSPAPVPVATHGASPVNAIATSAPTRAKLEIAGSNEPAEVAAPNSAVVHLDPRPPRADKLKVKLPACAVPTGVYFSEVQNGTILRLDLKTRESRTIANVMADDLALDSQARQLYFTTEDKWIARISTEGKDKQNVFGELPNPYCLALDFIHKQIVWTNQTQEPRIQRAALHGKDLTTVVKGSGCCTVGIALDIEDHRVYWMDGYYKGRVMRADLDGGYEQQIATTVGIANGIDVDAAGGKLYWTEYGNGLQDDVVRRANLDGTQVETLLTGADGLSTPQHIAVDHAGGYFYFADLHAGRVLRAKLDGSHLETIWQSSAQPRAIALDRPEPCQ